MHYGWKLVDTMTKAKVEKLVGRMYLNGLKIKPVGSSMIPGARTPDSGFDFLVYGFDTKDYPVKTEQLLLNNGFDSSGSQPDINSFVSVKLTSKSRDTINFIIVWDDEKAQSFLAAQELVEKLKVTDKNDRITIFDFLRGGSGNEEDFQATVDKYSSSKS